MPGLTFSHPARPIRSSSHAPASASANDRRGRGKLRGQQRYPLDKRPAAQIRPSAGAHTGRRLAASQSSGIPRPWNCMTKTQSSLIVQLQQNAKKQQTLSLSAEIFIFHTNQGLCKDKESSAASKNKSLNKKKIIKTTKTNFIKSQKSLQSAFLIC